MYPGRVAVRCAAWTAVLSACGCPAEPVEPTVPPGPPQAWVGYRFPVGSDLLFDGLAPAAGRGLVVVDADGVVGEGEVVPDPPPDCDDCPRARFVVRLAGDPRTPLEPMVALSPPVADGARLVWLPFPGINTLDESASVWAEIDRDADGATDLEVVVRCGEFIGSGCDGRVCSSVCRGLREPGDPAPRDELCEGFIPDLEDCLPDEE